MHEIGDSDSVLQEATPTGLARWSELLVAAIVILMGVVIVVQARDLNFPRSVRVSPRVFPYMVGTGLIGVGIWYILDICRAPHTITGGEDSEDVDVTASTHWGTLVSIGVALTLFAFTVERLGFALAAALLFAIASTAMGSKRIAANIAVGVVLGVAVYVVFNSWLGVRLPGGVLQDVLP